MKSTYETLSEQLSALYLVYCGLTPSDLFIGLKAHEEPASRYNFCVQWTLEENGWTEKEYLGEYYRNFPGY